MYSGNDTATTTHIGPITDEIVDGLVKEFQRKKIKDKIMKHMIDPILCDIAEKYYPHVVTLMTILTLIILLMVSTLIIGLNSYKNQLK